MILASLALLASSAIASADEEARKAVDEIQFGKRSEQATGAGVDPKLFQCYKTLTENEFPRSQPKRIIVTGSQGEQSGLIAFSLGRPSLFAPLPESAREWNGKPVKLLIRDEKPLFAMITQGELSALPDKQNLNGTETIRFAEPADEQTASVRLAAHAGEKIRKLHDRFKARPKGSSPTIYLEKLETCRKIPDPTLRGFIDDEIQKFARPS